MAEPKRDLDGRRTGRLADETAGGMSRARAGGEQQGEQYALHAADDDAPRVNAR